MSGSRRSAVRFLTAAVLVAGCASLLRSTPPDPTPSEGPAPTPSKVRVPTYSKILTLGSGTEWRFQPLVVDLNRDGHLDLVATARLVTPALHMWLGDGKEHSRRSHLPGPISATPPSPRGTSTVTGSRTSWRPATSAPC